MASLNKLGIFHNQLLEHNETECEGISVSGIVGNLLGIPCDPDFSYAMALRAAGSAPTTAGADPKAAMMGAILWGCLPEADDTFDAADKGELYIANPANYSSFQYGDALTHTMNGSKQLYSFDEVKAEILAGNPVNLGIVWWDSFMRTLSDGILPPISGSNHLHSVAVYDYDPVADLLICEPHLGPTFAAQGYVKMSRAKFSNIFQNAYAFDAAASRWLTICIYLVTQKPFLLPYLTSLLKASNPQPMQEDTTSSSTPPQIANSGEIRHITDLATAIKAYEGMGPEFNNPLALRYSPYENGTRSVPGKGTFAWFKTYAAGWQAGIHQLTIVCKGTSPAYTIAARHLGLASCADMTLNQFMATYSPSSDNNDPQRYAATLGKELSVDPALWLMKHFV